GGGEAEHAVSSRDQPPGEPDPLGFVTVEQLVRSPAGHDRCQLPGEIDGVANPRIHALAAGRTVDVRGIAEQEGSDPSEMLRHPVMHMIGREPIHLLDLNLEVIDRPIADVLELKCFGAVGALVAYGPDEACATLPG